MKKEVIEKLFGNSEATYYRWKKEGRPIVQLIEKYFNDKELEEFIEKRKISKINYIQKLLPSIGMENGISISFNKLNELKSIIGEDEIKNEKTVFADFLIYLNSYEEEINIEDSKYYYIADSTYADKYQKIELIKENDIPLDTIINFLADLDNDMEKTIEIIKKENKYFILYYIIDFIAPVLDMKYNKKLDFYEKDFTDHICKMYDLPYTNEAGYIEEHRNDIKKEMIVGAIDSFLYKIINNGEKNEQK